MLICRLVDSIIFFKYETIDRRVHTFFMNNKLSTASVYSKKMTMHKETYKKVVFTVNISFLSIFFLSIHFVIKAQTTPFVCGRT